jgi:hypothetical protein
MTPATIKNLAISLANKMVEHFENTTGVKIPVEQAKLDVVDKTLKDAALAKMRQKPSPSTTS